jgi:hypothetical protein
MSAPRYFSNSYSARSSLTWTLALSDPARSFTSSGVGTHQEKAARPDGGHPRHLMPPGR